MGKHQKSGQDLRLKYTKEGQIKTIVNVRK